MTNYWVRASLMSFMLTICLSAVFLPAAYADKSRTETAYFAGGCFWCMEAAYQEVPGVIDVISGFTGGTLKHPIYNGNHAGHYESVKVIFDPDQVSYSELVDRYWHNIDPFDARGQFCDKGSSYRAAIFYNSVGQEKIAEKTRQAVMEKFPSQQVVTQVLPATEFWPVEEAHQDYYLKNPVRYKYYRFGCRRDARLEAVWGEAPTH